MRIEIFIFSLVISAKVIQRVRKTDEVTVHDWLLNKNSVRCQVNMLWFTCKIHVQTQFCEKKSNFATWKMLKWNNKWKSSGTPLPSALISKYYDHFSLLRISDQCYSSEIWIYFTVFSFIQWKCLFFNQSQISPSDINSLAVSVILPLTWRFSKMVRTKKSVRKPTCPRKQSAGGVKKPYTCRPGTVVLRETYVAICK